MRQHKLKVGQKFSTDCVVNNTTKNYCIIAKYLVL